MSVLLGCKPSANHWEQTGGPEGGYVHAVVIDPNNPNVLYATINGAGVLKSADAGGTWSVIGLIDEGTNTIAINPENPSTVFVGTPRGVYKTTNGGADWGVVGLLSMTGITAIIIDPIATNTIYVSADGVVYRSANAGVDWVLVNSGLESRHVNVALLKKAVYSPCPLHRGLSDGTDRQSPH